MRRVGESVFEQGVVGRLKIPNQSRLGEVNLLPFRNVGRYNLLDMRVVFGLCSSIGFRNSVEGREHLILEGGYDDPDLLVWRSPKSFRIDPLEGLMPYQSLAGRPRAVTPISLTDV